MKARILVPVNVDIEVPHYDPRAPDAPGVRRNIIERLKLAAVAKLKLLPPSYVDAILDYTDSEYNEWLVD